MVFLKILVFVKILSQFTRKKEVGRRKNLIEIVQKVCEYSDIVVLEFILGFREQNNPSRLLIIELILAFILEAPCP